MTVLADIVGLHLQPIAIPVGWKIVRNSFFAIDPDDDLSGRQLTFDSAKPNVINDPWDDVVSQYFDCSCHWVGIRCDNLCEITLEYPMGDRHGEFRLREYHNNPIKFTQSPKLRLKRKHEDVKLVYELEPPFTPSEHNDFDNPNREFHSRKRAEIVGTLEQWLIDDLW